MRLLLSKWEGVALQVAQSKAALGCSFLQKLVTERPLSAVSPEVAEEGCSVSLSVLLDDHPKVQFNWEGGRYDGLYYIYAAPGAPPAASPFVDLLPPNLAPNSELSFKRIKSWLSECSASHIKCPKHSGNFMPRRVLHISKSGEGLSVRLSSDHSPGKYATLSYCWGGDQPSKTLQPNFQSYLSDIPLGSLPLTIQHAAIVTHGIGLPYLWVDAMCIIQDDEEDKFDQIAQMHAIYNNSWVTIAAAEAKVSGDGFLQPRGQWQPVKMKARFDDNVFSDVLLVPQGLGPMSCRPDAPLFQRGWTMQETLLSSRILLYGHRELTFLCLEDEKSEGGLPPDIRHYQIAYSQRLLTVEDDKLLGIGALAEAYGRRKGLAGYVAGMWKTDFLQQCLWTTETTNEEHLPRRPVRYRAPSWSWASLDAHISSFGVSANMPAMMLPETMPPNSTCRIIDIQTTLVTLENPFGMVSDGYLTIQGKMRELTWHNKGIGWREEGRLDGSEYRSAAGLASGSGSPLEHRDMQSDEARGYALLLKEVESETGTFQRVGRLEVTERDGFDDWFDGPHEWKEIVVV
ncbi:hypothetical protein CSOJ01_02253 [Colletotrichum sojae]|uniref:Heterokaryon incompatibility domain-containing protein n=1 Tax=Colletotrichum sojae TaxID=2175907 RepID=A0A8H6N362_9PEZI|nr:hypothetical protein CSOJ01_02253 [Colletotrichum sojae]